MHTRKSYSIEPALQGTHLRPKEFILHIPIFLPNSSLNSTGHYHNCLYPRTSSPNGPNRKIDHQWFGSRNPPEPEESILQVSSCIPRTFYTTEPALQDRHLRPKELILHIPTFFKQMLLALHPRISNFHHAHPALFLKNLCAPQK